LCKNPVGAANPGDESAVVRDCDIAAIAGCAAEPANGERDGGRFTRASCTGRGHAGAAITATAANGLSEDRMAFEMRRLDGAEIGDKYIASMAARTTKPAH
jgi:hypothetical protein